uniref:glycogenin glucosyltransferase n=1 Tax=Plectus sambesii TaxID=2011161 RepID=A0A914UTH8_9BILA
MTEAWVTLATNDAYALGALVLAQSLRRAETTRKIHCLVTPGVSGGMREHMNSVFDAVTQVDILNSGDQENLQLIGRPDLGVTFTKLHCWRLTQYTRCVFLDADTLVLRNSDELFQREELSAAPDIGWPDIFNTGVFVFRPSLDTYRALLSVAISEGSFDGGDQGLLNTYFSDWREKDASFRLPFIFNMSSGAVYTYAAAYKKFGADVKIVHFLGSVKPWHHSFGPGGLRFDAGSTHQVTHVSYWWRIFAEDLASKLKPEFYDSQWCPSGVRDAAHFAKNTDCFGQRPCTSTGDSKHRLYVSPAADDVACPPSPSTSSNSETVTASETDYDSASHPNRGFRVQIESSAETDDQFDAAASSSSESAAAGVHSSPTPLAPFCPSVELPVHLRRLLHRDDS